MKDCFVAGTLIKTEQGYKAIEEIEVGDKVWSWDEESGEQALKTVVQLFRNTKTIKTTVTIESEDGTVDEIISTPGHKYYLPFNKIRRNQNEQLEHASYDGCFVLYIVLELYKKLSPQLGFNREFLSFLLKLKNFTDIDIDEYIN